MAYAIWNMVTGDVTTTAPSRPLIEKWFNWHNMGFKQRGPEQVICAFPDGLGLTITNYREFLAAIFFEGMQRYLTGE